MLGYKAFIDACFDTYKGKGQHAVLRAYVENYVRGFGDTWDDAWRVFFVDATDRKAWLARFTTADATDKNQGILLTRCRPTKLRQAYGGVLGGSRYQGVASYPGQKSCRVTALGQKRNQQRVRSMSAVPFKAEMGWLR